VAAGLLAALGLWLAALAVGVLEIGGLA
jgi:hypothetical protein